MSSLFIILEEGNVSSDIKRMMLRVLKFKFCTYIISSSLSLFTLIFLMTTVGKESSA